MDPFITEQVGKLYLNVVQLQDLVGKLKMELKQKHDEILMLKASKSEGGNGSETKGESLK